MPIGVTFRGMMAAAGVSGYTCDAADFDGANDYMSRGADLTGNANSKLGIVSFWIKMAADGSVLRIIDGQGTYNNVQRSADNTMRLYFLNGSTTLARNTTSTFVIANGWVHYMASWDLSGPTVHIYRNGVDDDAGGGTLLDNAIDYTRTDHYAGSASGGGSKWDGDIADLYYAPGQYLDLSNSANRDKFYLAGKPVDLGADGSTPTGTAPLVFFHLDDGEAAANFATNRGTGGDYSITGTLATASTSPTD